MDHPSIYLVFSKTGTWLSRLITLFSPMKYAHTSISFDPSFTQMYSFGRINPNNPFSGGFVVENLFGGVYKKFPRCTCMIYKIGVTEEQLLSLQEQVASFLREKEAYRYNLLGLFGVLFNQPLKREKRYFCSQFVAELLINSSIYSSPKVPELIRTSDLFTIENKEVIYEGIVKDFSK
ncbi:MAG TPA: hypothetical protein GXZ98_00565 [Firmicutes bacterium]|jgi:hypothetical protein|nr:hypothetical protein [Bacillota bacterium]